MNEYNHFKIPKRLWEYLVLKTGIPLSLKWADLGKKQQHVLLNTLLNDQYAVKGKTTFKEEFVTCGGIKLEDIHFDTLESKKCPNLFFAGEVLDVDGITGGFNFQNAWTTSFIAAKAIAKLNFKNKPYKHENTSH